jgi:hypothetical protein
MISQCTISYDVNTTNNGLIEEYQWLIIANIIIVLPLILHDKKFDYMRLAKSPFGSAIAKYDAIVG